MNKELQDKLLEQSTTIFQMLIDGIQATKDFALEQLPDIVMQYLLFYRSWYGFLVVVSVLLMVWGIPFFSYWVYKAYKAEYDGFPQACVGVIGGAIPSFAGFIMLCLNIKQAILVWTAPKVFLIQQLVEMVKK